MAKSVPVLRSVLFFILIHRVLSGRRGWWPPYGNIMVQCPYKDVKEDLSGAGEIPDPCSGAYQPICGTDFQTYKNPCLLCIESLKTRGAVKYKHNGKC
nr:putative serine peptidase inhibitor Kazal type 14 (putative) [Molossus molossus]